MASNHTPSELPNSDKWREIKFRLFIPQENVSAESKDMMHSLDDELSVEDLPENGIYLVDKPSGISSFGAVYALRRKLSEIHGKKVKVGHCGTLDPIATGLLILVTGKNTKRAGEFTKLDKIYIAEAVLGANSSTFDSEGDLKLVSSEVPSKDIVEVALKAFFGKGEQIPPIFSAIKIGGKRAYKLAREGSEPVMLPRQIEVFKIELIDYHYPKLNFKVHVSSGTYIRSIINDLGVELKTGAYMGELRRISIGEFKL